MLDYIILGIIQGIFEWLPISSEGIIGLIIQFLDKDINPIDTALFLHLGTLLAILIYFRKDWLKIFTLKQKQVLRFLIITTAISLVIGFPLYKLISNIKVGIGLLALIGLGLFITSFFQNKKRRFNISEDGLAILVGALQGLSVIPGVSRSGSTIFGLSLKRESPQEILKTSYLISVPVVFSSSLYLFLKNPVFVFKAWPALLFSFLVGIVTLKELLTLSQKINFRYFTLIFGLLCLLGAVLALL